MRTVSNLFVHFLICEVVPSTVCPDVCGSISFLSIELVRISRGQDLSAVFDILEVKFCHQVFTQLILTVFE